MLLQGNSWRLRFDGLSLRFWQKTNSFATLTRVFFSQTSTRVHQILIPTHNHELTSYPSTRKETRFHGVDQKWGSIWAIQMFTLIFFLFSAERSPQKYTFAFSPHSLPAKYCPAGFFSSLQEQQILKLCA